MFTELFMGDFQDDGAVDPAGEGDQDGLHVQDHLAECREFTLEGVGRHEFLPIELRRFLWSGAETFCGHTNFHYYRPRISEVQPHRMLKKVVQQGRSERRGEAYASV